MSITSKKPYIIRALHEWISDNKLTPYIAVNATIPETHVPQQYVKNGQIILNIAYDAVNKLNINNHHIIFDATFNAVPFEVFIPMRAVQAIYAAENGQGMIFDEKDEEPPPTAPEPIKKTTLRIVK
jgi:stringent starvation protein B